MEPSHCSICILSSDRIFARILAALLRDQFRITIAQNTDQVISFIEHEQLTLILAEGSQLNSSLLSTLIARRKTFGGFPHVLIFRSLNEVHDIDTQYKSVVDKVLTKPPGIEEILRSVLEMTMSKS